MSKRRMAALGLTGVLLAGGTGAAVAAVTRDHGRQTEQAILDDAAKRLDVTPQRLRDALRAAQDAQLDEAVRDGRLTQEQADAIKARRQRSGRVLGGPFGGPHGLRGRAFGVRLGLAGGLARALGITPAELHRQLHDGKSVADIAKAEGRSLDDVRTAAKADARRRIDAAVKDGDLTRQQADRLLTRLDRALEDLDRVPRLRGRMHRGGGPGMRPGALRPGEVKPQRLIGPGATHS
jgi:hypothetical protein